MRIGRLLAAGIVSVTFVVGATSPASARVGGACAHANHQLGDLHKQETKIEGRISKLQTAIGATQATNRAAKLQRRLTHLQAREAKITDAISRIQSDCPSAH